MRVELDNGLVGWGESYGAQLDAMPALFTGCTEPLAVGQDAGDRRLTSTIQQGALPSIVLEAVFLMKARRHRCRSLWINHVGKAREAGLDDDTVAALGDGSIPAAPAAVRAAAHFEQALAETHCVPQPLYDDVAAELGPVAGWTSWSSAALRLWWHRFSTSVSPRRPKVPKHRSEARFRSQATLFSHRQRGPRM
ncbi:hypothetical protein NF681_00630 (plasmid) [Comamonadaceae bacterium OTU4NAUVB1]|nr:hypothetical protein NF681_00630 [Comamonadaceae bacterium OTU4NAUVB1]